MGNQPGGPDGRRPTDEFGEPRPTREQREAASLEKHGDGMSPEARAELLREIGAIVNGARQSIEVSVSVQIIPYHYPGDPHERNRTGAGRTITITLDGGEGSGQIGEVPVGTFPEAVGETAAERDTGAATANGPGPRPIGVAESAVADTGAREGTGGQDGAQS